MDAVETANFWDERTNTWLVSVTDEVISEVGFHDRVVESFLAGGLDTSLEGEDFVRFESLPAREKLDLYFSAALLRTGMRPVVNAN